MSMATNQEYEIANMGGGYGGGGSWCVIIVVFLVAFLLFRRDGFDGHAYGAPYAGGCGPCVQPTFKDESNWEEESHLKDKLCCIEKEIWKTDQDVWKTACETQKEVHCDGEKTRELIRCEVEKNLREKIAEQAATIGMMRSEAFNEKRFDMIEGMIAKLGCEIPKRQPVWAETVTPLVRDLDIDRRRDFDFDRPRRRDCCDI